MCLNFNYNNTVMTNKSSLLIAFYSSFEKGVFQRNGSPRKIVKDRNRIVTVKKRKDSSLSINSSEGFYTTISAYFIPSILSFSFISAFVYEYTKLMM